LARLSIVGLCLVLMLSAISQTMLSQEFREPTPDTSPQPEPEFIFPSIGLDCPTFETPIVGATWNNITIGQTTFADFERILFELGSYSRAPDGFYGGTSIAYTLPYKPDIGWHGEQLPALVAICTQDDIITVLVASNGLRSLSLDNYIYQYGQPDLLTWDLTPYYRLAFWFEHGVVVQAFVGSPPDRNIGWGKVGLVIYLPSQPLSGYQMRWPYNQTWRKRAYDDYNEGIVTKENPFNIPATILAMTQNPTWIPTPTFTPRPSLTAAPSPTP
jgi:hypothetical protein